MSTCIAFAASKRPEAQEALQRLTQKYGQYDEDKADVIVALGGDGAMLDAMRRRFEDHKPVYGMNRGTVGFLMNEYDEEGLIERIDRAERATVTPLRMEVTDVHDETSQRLAINEVSLLRQTAQTGSCFQPSISLLFLTVLPPYLRPKVSSSRGGEVSVELLS